MTEAVPPEALDWVLGRCREAGLTPLDSGEVVHDRPWSRAAVFETDAGRVWFKANGTGTAHEPRLLGLLQQVTPDLVPRLLAADAGRGWSLTRDAGPTLRSVLPAARQWPVWEQLLARYAAAQLASAAHREELLAVGVPERSPATLPEQAARLVEDLATTDAACGGVDDSARQRLEARLPAYRQWCEELAGGGLPLTLQHDDLHANNVCWGGSAATSRVIDWGDASIGHPFGTLLSTLSSLVHHAGVDPEDAQLVRVRDAYLEPFSAYADRATLARQVALARRAGRVTRALVWRAALDGAPTSAHAEFDFPVRGWLEEILED